MAAAGVFVSTQYIDPSIAHGPWSCHEALLGPIVGGLGTVWGPLLGALVLNLLGEATRGLLANAPGVNLIVYGVVLVAMVSFLPRGLAGLKK